MSSTSASDVDQSAESSQESRHESLEPPSHQTSRRQSDAPLTPRKRRRIESCDPSRVRKPYLEDKYNDAYRVLFNEDVNQAAARFETSVGNSQHQNSQVGVSVWSAKEKATFFGALDRLGRDDIRGIAGAIGTKSIPETQELLLLLHDAAAQQGHAKLEFRDIPAAIEVGRECTEQLDIAGDALAWYQESSEASQEHAKFGEYWLITPTIAEQIENSLGPGRLQESRAASPVPKEPEGPRRGGKVVVGACFSCKKFKQKCDRQIPCGNCVRRKTQACEYPPSSLKPTPEDATEGGYHAPNTNPNTDSNADPTMDIIEAIPEASLLQPRVMLTLSKNIFMNRSPAIPSPWPHWSEYASDVAKEPSIYRSAFNDLHTLVISVTKRLMQTAIIQTFSRLRSQIRRTKKGGLPVVRRRDVLAAIDIVGMKRSSKERWKGVARRCALQVYDVEWSRTRRTHIHRDMPWDEVEQALASEESLAEGLTTDAETSGNEKPDFKSRAVRSGTPLPMEGLTLSDSEDGSEAADRSSRANSDSDESMVDETRAPSLHPTDSMPSGTVHGETLDQRPTLEQYDREANRREEQALWAMLKLEPPPNREENLSDEECHPEDDEKIVTLPNGWRSWTDYHAEWEEFETPVSPSDFTANQKPLPNPPITQPRPSGSPEARSSPVRYNSSTSPEPQQRPKPKPKPQSELQAQGTRAYAALQSRTSEPMPSVESSSSSPEPTKGGMGEEDSGDDSSSIDVDMYRPTQSIEVPRPQVPAATPDMEMDWDAFID